MAKGCLSCPKGHETTPSATTALRNIHKQAKAPFRCRTGRGLCLCAIGLHSQKATSVSPQTVQTHTHQAPHKEPPKAGELCAGRNDFGDGDDAVGVSDAVANLRVSDN